MLSASVLFFFAYFKVYRRMLNVLQFRWQRNLKVKLKHQALQLLSMLQSMVQLHSFTFGIKMEPRFRVLIVPLILHHRLPPLIMEIHITALLRIAVI